jgi:hypothetical protein
VNLVILLKAFLGIKAYASFSTLDIAQNRDPRLVSDVANETA